MNQLVGLDLPGNWRQRAAGTLQSNRKRRRGTFLAASGFLDLAVSGGLNFQWGFLTAMTQMTLESANSTMVYDTNDADTLFAVNRPIVFGDGHVARNLTSLHHLVGSFQMLRIPVSLGNRKRLRQPFPQSG